MEAHVLSFVTIATQKHNVDIELMVFALLRTNYFLVERGPKELSLAVYDRLHPRKFKAFLHVIFSVEGFLHKINNTRLMVETTK